ncbi:MAG: alpha/beta fold hydrolase [Chloroflexi bacterium]|nr:alpha/beta fold hydrolase [Chloroflexota bacterium]
MKLRFILVVVLILLSLPVIPASAQADLQPVTITAEDGLVLYGLYSGTEGLEGDESGVPAVLLMHHGNAVKEKWLPFIPMLTEANYAVLTVDVRGFGETGRGENAPTAEERISDAQRWVDWLREQDGVDPERINIVGASIGGDIGLNIMAQDEGIVSITVLSVGLEVEDITTAPAVEQITRPIYFITGREDEVGLEAVQELINHVQGEMLISIHDTSMCCTFLIDFVDGVDADIVAWLDRHNK